MSTREYNHEGDANAKTNATYVVSMTIIAAV